MGEVPRSRNVHDVPTPAIVISRVVVERNIARMAEYCRGHGLKLRPHFKTHKSAVMARKQLEAGAVGLTFAKVGEAEVMGAGAKDVLLAYPALDAERTGRIARLAGAGREAGVPVRVGVDSGLAIEHLAEAARRAGATLGILIEVDVGFHRVGVQTAEAAVELAGLAAKTEGVRFDGLVCFPGHLGAAADRGAVAAGLAKVDEMLQGIVERLKKSGIEAAIVSGGSSPTAGNSHLVKSLTEIRPGTYIYNDRNMLVCGWCTVADCAARVVATVVSDAVPGKVVIDAGSKVLTSDRCARNGDTAGFGMVLDYEEARIVRLSEEHGEIDVSKCATRPRLGQRVSVIPNHICPCINLQDWVWVKQEDGMANPLRVDARGCVV